MDSQEALQRRFAAIAFGLGMHGANSGDVRTELFHALAGGEAGPGSRIPKRALQRWFGGECAPISRNETTLAHAIERIAKTRGKVFKPEWLRLEAEEILSRFGADVAAFEVFYARMRGEDTRPTVTLDVVIAREEAERLGREYYGAYCSYWFDGQRDEVRRTLLVIGPEFQRGVPHCLLHTGANLFHGFAIPAPHCLHALLTANGDSRQVCTIVIDRYEASQGLFGAVGVRVANRRGVPFAYKCLIKRAPSLKIRADAPESALAPHLSLAKSFKPKSSVYESLRPWLGLGHASESKMALGLGAEMMWMSSEDVQAKLADFVDPDLAGPHDVDGVAERPHD